MASKNIIRICHIYNRSSKYATTMFVALEGKKEILSEMKSETLNINRDMIIFAAFLPPKPAFLMHSAHC